MTRSISELALQLHAARKARLPVPQPPAGSLDIEAAYRVQAQGMALRRTDGELPVGCKMGFTSRAKMAQMGVHEMIVGQLTDAMQVADGGPLERAFAIHPRVEPEIAFLIARDLSEVPHAGLLGSAVEAMAPALEVIDSRYADFRFALADVIADNTSALAFALGPWQRVPRCIDNLGIALRFNGRDRQLGSSAAILGSPWRSLEAAWRLARRYDLRIAAGNVLLAGAATVADPLPACGRVEAEVECLGRVALTVT
jgi:2-oxo-3-hexenedioate decarboxylase